MKTLGLQEYFDEVGYDWRKDEESMRTICHYTKTRVNPAMNEVRLTWGTEQTFLIKAVAESVGARSFFEIGTGRGTACYALSLIPEMKEIHTVDILDFNQKFATAIGFKPVTVSLSDIRNMIPFDEKSKIKFHHRKEFGELRAEFPGHFDLAFIDGDHDNEAVILEDYALCRDIVKPGGLILWDDYDEDRFAVKPILEKLLLEDSSLSAMLVEQRGHLFNDKPREHGKGVVIMRHG